ncbi:MAG: type II secretion system F family protein [Planctomyces sp.]|nr:type II secretion system F family protein [Planctomyces sp.]
MNSVWIIAFGLALGALLAIRNMFSRRAERSQSMFRAQLNQGQGEQESDRFVDQQSNVAAPVMAGVASGDRQATTVARPSTWSDRRLFSDFRGIVGDELTDLVKPDPEELPIRDDEYVFGPITPSLAQLLPETAARREIQRKSLLGAGYRSRASWLNLTATRFVLAFFSLISIGFWLIMAPPSLEPWLLAMVVVVPMLMWAIPPLVVSVKASDRKIDIERGLPDVLDMLNMGVSQGLSVEQCFRRISGELSEAHPALADELRLVTQQSDVGSLSQALRNLNYRIDSPEVSSFTSLLIQSESTGTSISRALGDYSDSIRSSLKERADSRANAASFKLLFPVALCLMPSVFLFLLGPAIVQLSDFLTNGAEALNSDRQNAMDSLQQQPRLDLSRFSQNGF